jgi:hypothetical protein
MAASENFKTRKYGLILRRRLISSALRDRLGSWLAGKIAIGQLESEDGVVGDICVLSLLRKALGFWIDEKVYDC